MSWVEQLVISVPLVVGVRLHMVGKILAMYTRGNLALY